jgi:hypothetical protein
MSDEHNFEFKERGDCLRLYFNQAGPKPWSIDTGEGTAEICIKMVSINKVWGLAYYKPDAADGIKAWIQLTGAKVQFFKDSAYILPEEAQ